MARNIKYIVVHCTAGSMNSTMQDTLKFHTKPESEGGRGWKKGGYHWYVDKNGGVSAMVPEDELSNGVTGHNAESINIVYAGGIEQDSNGKNCNTKKAKDTRTSAQVTALLNKIKDIKSRYPDAKVVGHHYFAAKACPSFDAGKEYESFGGIPAGKKFKSSGSSSSGSKKSQSKTKSKESKTEKVEGQGFKATTSQLNQFEGAFEPALDAVVSTPQTITDTIEQLKETYTTIVDTFSKAQQKIPISIPDPMEVVNQKLQSFKEAGEDMSQSMEVMSDNIIKVPDGTDIPESQSMPAMMNKMGGLMAIFADLISPATDFIANSQSIIDQSITGVTKSVSGLVPPKITKDGRILSVDDIITDDEELANELMEQQASSMNIGDIASVGLNGITAGVSIVGDISAGTLALAMGGASAVAGVALKIPGLIPKFISKAMSFSMDAAGSAVDSASSTIGSAASSETITSATGSLAALNELEVDEITNSNDIINSEEVPDETTEDLSNIVNADEIANSVNSAVESAQNAIKAAEESSKKETDPHLETEEDFVLVESIADSNEKIKKFEREFKQTYCNKYITRDLKKVLDLESELNLKLYGEIRKSFLEILPDITDDSMKSNADTFVAMATYAALKTTPSIIDYLESKFQIFEQKINTLVDNRVAAYLSSHSLFNFGGSSNDSEG